MNGIVKKIYNMTLRPYLPKKLAAYNGVIVRRPRLLDQTDVYKDYEQTLLSHIQQYVPRGSVVVIVGGGLGVSSVYAVRSGARKVQTYEASSERASIIRETVDLNKVTNKVEVDHAVVEMTEYVEGSVGDADGVQAKDLPSCDVLVLDCEGVELEILKELSQYPKKVIVECHPMFDVEVEQMVEVLQEYDYEIQDQEAESVTKGQITILTASREDSWNK